jgi:signal transduction histidine kinase
MWKVHRTALLGGLTGLLLLVLAALQYSWVGALSQFERQQMSRTLEVLTEGLVRDLDRTFGRIGSALDVGRPRNIAEELLDEVGDWAESADFPALVSDVLWIDPGEDGLRLQRLDADTGRLEELAWTDSLRNLEAPLARIVEDGRRRFRQDGNVLSFVDEDRIAFAVAQDERWPPSWAVALMRRDVLEEKLLPHAVEEYFGPEAEREFDIWIVGGADATEVIYASNPGADPAGMTSPDILEDLDDDGPAWSVAASHRSGSLDAFVGQYRVRNISLGFGVVVVLGISFVFLAVAKRRAEWLADRQMEFVAGVSHELRTPIAGIASLSQNLADGVVRDPDHAAHYGLSIHKESRRLANMVDTVLRFAAIRSGRYRYDLRPVDLASIIEREVDALTGVGDGQFDVETAIEAALPAVVGDEEALGIVVRNLVSNAVKFGGESGTVVVSARSTEGPKGPEVEVSVRDRGPGISGSDLPHIFKPFYRGQDAREGQVGGSGLGLSLVREIVDAHRGRLEVDTRPGAGAEFRVSLSAARESPDGRLE